MEKAVTQDDLRNLPPVIGLQEASRLLGFSRQHGYDLARRGEYPVPVHKVGGRYHVPTAPILRYLGVNERDHSGDTHAPTSNGETHFSRANRRTFDFHEPVTMKTKDGRRVKIDPEKTYRRNGRKVLGAQLIEEKQKAS